MAGRPSDLFGLFAGLESLDGIGPKTAKLLANINIQVPRDLLLTLPVSGISRARSASVQGPVLPQVVTVAATVVGHQPPRTRSRPYRVEMEDRQTTFFLVFFHARADYLERILPVGAVRIVSGKAELFDGLIQITHPDHIVPEAEADSIPVLEPVYPLTHGVTQKTMAKAALAALRLMPEMAEWIDPGQMAKESWPSWAAALTTAHKPAALDELSAEAPARRRLAYDELFAHQLTLALARLARDSEAGIASIGTGNIRDKILKSLPYNPTGAQLRALSEIDADLAKPVRMNRLLQGDVGAGKTLVAVAAMATIVEAGGQAVLMAPTEVLARQHFASIRAMVAQSGLRVALLTGRDGGKARQEILADLVAGQIDILIGTHAVFQKDVFFQDLRLAVIDEQHRFGVRERLALGQKGAAVDVLVMTATPIPRSLSLAQYGDMDVSVLDEKPPGRQPITTALVANTRMEEVLARLQQVIAQGQQVYWVCPLVEESETLTLTAAEDRFKHLRARFGDAVVGLVHGQMPPAAKDSAMADFVAGRSRILVATTVIEVGVDVPNATIMVIEGAENFGLAQLHQLRGRVGRGAQKSSCLLMFQAPLGKTAQQRLSLMRETEDGFRISEVDLEMRGAGDVIGVAQSGLPRFRIADLERQAGLMAVAQSDARALLALDPGLTTPRGMAARRLLWVMGKDESIRLIRVG